MILISALAEVKFKPGRGQPIHEISTTKITFSREIWQLKHKIS